MMEQEFFNTFGIKPTYIYTVTDQFYTNDSHTYSATKDEIIEYFEGKNSGRYKIIKVQKCYPKISAECLLKLFVIGQDYFDFSFKGVCFKDVQELKDVLLRQMIRYENKRFAHSMIAQIQELFGRK